jgi:hypothetical protein
MLTRRADDDAEFEAAMERNEKQLEERRRHYELYNKDRNRPYDKDSLP